MGWSRIVIRGRGTRQLWCARRGWFIDMTLWPEYLELKAALDQYLNDATERIIREEVTEMHRKRASGVDKRRLMLALTVLVSAPVFAQTLEEGHRYSRPQRSGQCAAI